MGVEKMKTVIERKIKGQMQMQVLNKGYTTRRKKQKDRWKFRGNKATIWRQRVI